MSFPTGRAIYTFAGVDFIRVAESDEIVPWMYPELQYTKDAVLGGALTYLDSGAAVAPPLSFRAECLTSVDRSTLIAAFGTTGTLSNTRMHTDTVTLVKATPVNIGDYSRWAIDLIFEQRPS